MPLKRAESPAFVGSVDGMMDRLGDRTRFHYTDRKGAEAIAQTGVIRADSKGRAFVTTETLSARQAATNLFIGASTHEGRGKYLVALNVPEGVRLQRNAPLEEFHQGSLRIPSDAVLYVGENPWD